MGKFKTRYDAFFDSCDLQQIAMIKTNICNNQTFLPSTRILSAPLDRGKLVTIESIQNQEELFEKLEDQIRTYLDTDIMKRPHRRRKKTTLNLQVAR